MVDEARQPGEWPVAKVVDSVEEAVLVAGFLNGSGVPAEIESLRVEELPLNVGGLSGVRVRVRPESLAKALALLDERERASPDDAAEGADEP